MFDAYDTNNCTCSRGLTIAERTPSRAAEYEARVFGPYLVLRTREPTNTFAEYLDRAAQVMVVGKSLFIGDSDINFVTVRRPPTAWASSTTEAPLLELTISR